MYVLQLSVFEGKCSVSFVMICTSMVTLSVICLSCYGSHMFVPFILPFRKLAGLFPAFFKVVCMYMASDCGQEDEFLS